MDVNNITAGEDSNGGDSNGKVVTIALATFGSALLLFAGVVACYCYSSHNKRSTLNPQSQEETNDTQDPKEKDYELGESTGSTTSARTPTRDTSTSEEVASAADATGQQHREDCGEQTRILTPEEVWRKAKFFFPGLLKYSLDALKRKCKKAPHRGDVYFALQTHLTEELHDKLSELGNNNNKNEEEKRADFERLMKRENAAELCIALGMNKEVVHLRFQVIRNIEEELNQFNIPIGKTRILHSIQHLIDTIHVKNPFEKKGDIGTNKIISPYREKEWISYLGVHWPKGRIGETVTDVESILKSDPDIKDDFYVRGTSGRELEKICDDSDEEVVWVSKNGAGFKHDFGEGVYCFRKEIRWALSFAVDRAWPVDEDPNNAGTATVISSNPALVIFPKPNHSDIAKYSFEVGPSEPPLQEKGLKALQKNLKMRRKPENFDEFIRARKNWKEDNKLGYWKDFLKLYLCYGVDLTAGTKWRVLYGLMHDCNEGKRPLGDKAPTPDKDGWIQYCFKAGDYYEDLLMRETNMVFVEFCVDWKDWLDGSDSKLTQKLVEEQIKKKQIK